MVAAFPGEWSHASVSVARSMIFNLPPTAAAHHLNPPVLCISWHYSKTQFTESKCSFYLILQSRCTLGSSIPSERLRHCCHRGTKRPFFKLHYTTLLPFPYQHRRTTIIFLYLYVCAQILLIIDKMSLAEMVVFITFIAIQNSGYDCFY